LMRHTIAIYIVFNKDLKVISLNTFSQLFGSAEMFQFV
jgi:uncharacterized membrane protein YcfT